MISIKNLHITIDQKPVLQGVDLDIKAGALHALMGPNGSGKSSLAFHLMGHPGYPMSAGSVTFESDRNGESAVLMDLSHDVSVDARARYGIFLAFQQPYEVPGVRVKNFLKEAYQALHSTPMSVADFDTMCADALKSVGLSSDYAYRNVNEGFSGGEKKRLELAQMLLLKPSFAILDEIDSGLDLEGFALIGSVIARCREHNPSFSALIITHHPHLLDTVFVDTVHIMYEGKIIHAGEPIATLELLKKDGYEAFKG